MARLVLQTAEGQQIVELRQTNTLGRHPSNTIQLLDKIVSKEHCVIEQRGSIFVLRDLGSLNGTYINRERVQGEKDLKHNDEIALGQTKARFELTPVSQFPPPPSTVQQPWSQQGWPGSAPSQQQPQGQAQAYARQAPPQSLAPFPPQQQPPAQVQSQAQAGQGYPQPPGPPPPRGQSPQPPGSVAPSSNRRPPPPRAMRTPSRGFSTAYLPAITQTTHVDTDDANRQIGAEIVATERDFRPFDEVAANMNLLRADYERLRLSYELTRDIADEKDTTALLEKILKSIFRFMRAERGVIFLNVDGEMQPAAQHRTDGGKGAISISTTILNKVVEDRKAVLTHDAAMDFAASKGKSMILNQIQSAIVAPMLHKDELFGVLWIDSKSLAQFQPKDLELVTAVANQAAMFIEINVLGKQIQHEQLNRERLSRLLSPNVAERVIKGQVDVAPGGTRTECTVFNSDIRGFTRMSEGTSPEEIVEMLNAYFEHMVDTIFQYEGTLDKFMGDGIMAIWGAPVSHPDDPERSVECALEQVEVLGQFNRARIEQGKPPLGVGFGIHTGPVVAGYIGSSKALSYTVIGDVANTSARLCAKALAGQILVSEETRAKLSERFDCEELAPMRIRGKDKPMRVFNVVGCRPSEQVPSSRKVADHPTDPSAHAAADGAE
ncbi:MAG: FHA domain-containing protein [Myxococcales bacterium]|nr:FHA domain-containing protein [Myxococcales bacterium]